MPPGGTSPWLRAGGSAKDERSQPGRPSVHLTVASAWGPGQRSHLRAALAFAALSFRVLCPALSPPQPRPALRPLAPSSSSLRPSPLLPPSVAPDQALLPRGPGGLWPRQAVPKPQTSAHGAHSPLLPAGPPCETRRRRPPGGCSCRCRRRHAAAPPRPQPWPPRRPAAGSAGRHRPGPWGRRGRARLSPAAPTGLPDPGQTPRRP